MEFTQNEEPSIEKPIVIAAMQDMGNVGSIVINFINDSLRTKTFRIARTPYPTYVVIKEDILIFQMRVGNTSTQMT